jgi:lipid-binding SYLF domain-containing protein
MKARVGASRRIERHARRTNVGTRISKLLPALMLSALAMGLATPPPAPGASAATINREVDAALAKLYRENAAARLLREKAKGILVFPRMLKAGFLFGGQIGEGALLRNWKTSGYYNSVAASYGLQAGAQTFGYALFFMTDSALAYLDKSAGFEIGVGPSIVVVDAGVAKSLTTTTLTHDVYAFIFDQKGLMAGVGIQGSKITRVSK